MKTIAKPSLQVLTIDDYIQNCLLHIGEKAKKMSKEAKNGLHARLLELVKQFGI